MFVVGMGTCPAPPSPSSVGIPRADVKLPSLPPPVGPRSVESQAPARAMLPGFFEEGALAGRSLHRRPVERPVRSDDSRV